MAPSDGRSRPVFGQPPVDGTDEELEAWVERFVGELFAGGPQGDPFRFSAAATNSRSSDTPPRYRWVEE
jgi:hypothetical protein